MRHYLEILEIAHHPSRTLPLTVKFKAGSERHELGTNALHLQTFSAFQRHVLETIGVWVRHEAEVGDKAAREDWTHAVTSVIKRARMRPPDRAASKLKP